MSNAKNWRPCKDGVVFGFIITFIDNFRFIRNRVDLQQNHQGARVWKNVILPSLRGSNFKTRVHLSWFGIFIMKILRYVKSGDDYRGGSFIWTAWAHKTWSCATPWIQKKEKKIDQNKLNEECVEDLVHRDGWL
jgi:hypothetical protein